MDTTHDCLIVGGGAAGLSAAITIGRARCATLLVDAGEQSNLPAHGIGGLLGHDRRPPAQLYATGQAELNEYPAVTRRRAGVTALRRDGDGFSATLSDGSTAGARTVLLATGMDYRHPDLPGLAQRWGRSAFHCPFCHGWEVSGRPLAVLATGDAGVHMSRLLRAWSDEVTLVCGPGGLPGEDARRSLAGAGVAVEERAAAALRGPGDELEAIELQGGGEVACAGALVATTLRQRSTLAADLGVTQSPNPQSPDALAADAMGRTDVPGLFAAGDVVAGPPSVSRAVAAGQMAGASIVGTLMGVL